MDSCFLKVCTTYLHHDFGPRWLVLNDKYNIPLYQKDLLLNAVNLTALRYKFIQKKAELQFSVDLIPALDLSSNGPCCKTRLKELLSFNHITKTFTNSGLDNKMKHCLTSFVMGLLSEGVHKISDDNYRIP